MSREEEVPYEQDHLGNENKKIDTLRAQEGMVGGDTDEGIVQLTSADTGSDVLLFSMPTHADQAIVTELHAYNSQSSGGTFSLFEADLDGSGNIQNTTRRSVPIEVVGDATRINSYEGKPFDKAIAVSADFQGYIGVGVISDHKEYNEPESEDY